MLHESVEASLVETKHIDGLVAAQFERVTERELPVVNIVGRSKE